MSAGPRLLLVIFGAALAGCSGGPAPAPATLPQPPAPLAASSSSSPPPSPSPGSGAYVGSLACRPCHVAIYDRWKRTRMANVVVDPREHPEALLPDFTRPDPLVTFTPDAIAFVYGSRWKQRYFTRVGNDYFPLPAQWDVTHRTWRKYFVAAGTDWWVPEYPADNAQRPTGPLCDGCHSVNYDVRTHTVTEWNVGCERCHGPGGDHARKPLPANVVNPARLDAFHANDVCIQCHSQGRPLTNPIEGRAYDWPVGFRVGLDLKDFWKLEEHEPGKASFTHYADGTAHKNRMQGNDFVTSLMYARGVTCSSCHDVHGTSNDADLVLPTAEVCGKCHSPGGRNGPRAPTLAGHTHHRDGSTGSACVACHMPKIEQTIGDVNVRAHTFRFITPKATEQQGVPNPCTGCHTEKTPAWATAALRSWSTVSPWRL